MLKKIFIFNFLVLSVAFLFSPHLSAQPQFVMAKNLMFTNHGIIVNMNGHMIVTNLAVHVGQGVYEINDEYFGACMRCSWPLSKEGICTNYNCDQCGPRKNMLGDD